jgi:hypothetical protein
MSAIFAEPLFTKRVEEWLPRAEQADKERFERVFAALQPPAKAEERPKSAFPTAKPQHHAPKSAVNGWTHVTTKAALAKAATLRTQEMPAPPMRSLSNDGEQPLQESALPQPVDAESRGHSAPLGANRELASILKAKDERNKRSAQRSNQEVQKSPVCTTYHSGYNFRDDHPEMYQQAVDSTRSKPVPNFTFVSDWGDSLKRGSDPVWRERFMKSTYTAANNDTYPHFVTDFDATKERTFFDWMQRQKTYYGELMTPEKRLEFEKVFEAADVAKKREILESLRQVTSVVRPDSLKSHSQDVHCMMAKTEDPVLTAMTSHMVKVKTMGSAPPIIRSEDLPPPGQKMPPGAFYGNTMEKKASVQRPASAGAVINLSFGNEKAASTERPSSAWAMRGGSSGGGRPSSGTQGQRPQSRGTMTRPLSGSLSGLRDSKPVKVSIETHKSKVPMKWALGMTEPIISAYVDAYGSPGMRRLSSADTQHKPIKYKEVTAPIGSVNPHTALVPARAAYPVPQCYVQTIPFPQTSEDVTSDTIYRQDFYARSQEDTLRSMRDASTMLSDLKKVTLKSDIPLGKHGMTMKSSKDWVSEHHGEYRTFVVDIKGDRERAEALKAITSGPTASTGAVTASHRKRPATAV